MNGLKPTSILVAIYGVEPYLAACVDSILAQTYRDFELILVDDGTPDRCPAMCGQYPEMDGRVVVIHKSNGGLMNAWLSSLEIAEGQHVDFLDGDAWIDDGMYAAMMQAVTVHNADMVQYGIRSVGNAGVLEFGTPNHLEIFEKRSSVYAARMPTFWERKESLVFPLLGLRSRIRK